MVPILLMTAMLGPGLEVRADRHRRRLPRRLSGRDSPTSTATASPTSSASAGQRVPGTRTRRGPSGSSPASKQTPDIISSATLDLDGDGKAEVAIAFDFAMDQPKRGKLLLASQATPDEPGPTGRSPTSAASTGSDGPMSMATRRPNSSSRRSSARSRLRRSTTRHPRRSSPSSDQEPIRRWIPGPSGRRSAGTSSRTRSRRGRPRRRRSDRKSWRRGTRV